jgi:hypothetical protein
VSKINKLPHDVRIRLIVEQVDALLNDTPHGSGPVSDLLREARTRLSQAARELPESLTSGWND